VTREKISIALIMIKMYTCKKKHAYKTSRHEPWNQVYSKQQQLQQQKHKSFSVPTPKQVGGRLEMEPTRTKKRSKESKKWWKFFLDTKDDGNGNEKKKGHRKNNRPKC
jgi:hypothetical protein